MSNPALLKGQRIISPEGPGEVLEIIGENIVVRLDSGGTDTFTSEDVTDDSNAG